MVKLMSSEIIQYTVKSLEMINAMLSLTLG